MEAYGISPLGIQLKTRFSGLPSSEYFNKESTMSNTNMAIWKQISTSIESLCCIPETNLMLYVIDTSIKKKIRIVLKKSKPC